MDFTQALVELYARLAESSRELAELPQEVAPPDLSPVLTNLLTGVPAELIAAMIKLGINGYYGGHHGIRLPGRELEVAVYQGELVIYAGHELRGMAGAPVLVSVGEAAEKFRRYHTTEDQLRRYWNDGIAEILGRIQYQLQLSSR